jgi:hypothetical protein
VLFGDDWSAPVSCSFALMKEPIVPVGQETGSVLVIF